MLGFVFKFGPFRIGVSTPCMLNGHFARVLLCCNVPAFDSLSIYKGNPNNNDKKFDSVLVRPVYIQACFSTTLKSKESDDLLSVLASPRIQLSSRQGQSHFFPFALPDDG